MSKLIILVLVSNDFLPVKRSRFGHILQNYPVCFIVRVGKEFKTMGFLQQFARLQF